MSRNWRPSIISSVTVQPLINWDWRPLAGVSLSILILCREPTLRLSADSLGTWDGWKELRLHHCSYDFPFLFCLVCVSSPLPILPFLISILSFSYPFFYPAFLRTLYCIWLSRQVYVLLYNQPYFATLIRFIMKMRLRQSTMFCLSALKFKVFNSLN